MKNEQTRKRTAAILSLVVILAILLVGTYAWQSIRQNAINKVTLDSEPGARLHDDFDGRNKDVYMENYTSKEDGQPVYVRIRMSEYLETGNDAGEKTDDPARDAASLLPGADINDTSTWSIHTPGADSLEECDTVPSFHDYWTWELGGSTTYMPTFNKNNESLEADINGTWESVGPAGNRYSDYKSYTDGEEKTDDAQYAPNSSVGTEVTDDQGNVLYKEQNEIHTAKPTQDAKVIRMQDWLDGGAIPGKFWVWDTDGWAYWAEVLQPEEATGCLLTGISPTPDVSSNMYYAIDVVGEAASAFDWGNKGTGTNGTGDGATGFYEKGVTDNGRYLLDRIASVVTNADGDRYVDCGNNTYKKIEGEDSLGDLICAGKDKKPGTEDDKTNVIQLDTALNIDGTDYGTLFIGPDKNNTYWAMGKDKLLDTSDDVKIWYKGSGAFPGDPVNPDDFSFKGADGITVTNLTDGMEVEPGQSITNITTQVTLNGTPISNQDVTWTISGSGKQKASRLAGTKFDASSNTLTIDPDEKAGTKLTITIESDEDAKNACKTLTLMVVGPDEVSITSDGTEVTTEQTLKQGGSQTFVATVKRKGNIYTNNQVTWKLTGNTKAGTTLVDGVLTVDAEEPVGTILTITAISVDDTTVSVSITERVKKCVILGGETTVDIDGITWYVLAKEDDKTLIWAKDSVGTCQFDSSNNQWRNTCTAYQQLVTWLNSTTTLKGKAVDTKIYTRKAYNEYTQYNEMTCKVFLLSEADVFGTAERNSSNITNENRNKEYTFDGQQLVTDSTVRIGAGVTTWLRSPLNSIEGVGLCNSSGVCQHTYNGYYETYGLRPALWVTGL